MISRSTSETPGIRAGSFTPGPSHMNSSVTWVKDWYTPEISSMLFQNNGASFESVKLKGWYKTSVNINNSPAVKFDSDDVLDLKNWKYHKEAAKPEHSEEDVAVNDVKENGSSSTTKDELSSALSIKNKEEEIVSLSGITDT